MRPWLYPEWDGSHLGVECRRVAWYDYKRRSWLMGGEESAGGQEWKQGDQLLVGGRGLSYVFCSLLSIATKWEKDPIHLLHSCSSWGWKEIRLRTHEWAGNTQVRDKAACCGRILGSASALLEKNSPRPLVQRSSDLPLQSRISHPSLP